jgi:hypothetical protein
VALAQVLRALCAHSKIVSLPQRGVSNQLLPLKQPRTDVQELHVGRLVVDQRHIAALACGQHLGQRISFLCGTQQPPKLHSSTPTCI